MKKIILLLLVITVFCFPYFVKAESNLLYDVLKDEAESGGLAREYTGAHKDSFTEPATQNIYHWYAENNTEGDQIAQKNNIIFAGYCWKILRTTDTGGIKIIYNGYTSGGKCTVSGTIGRTIFQNEENSLAYAGYMYNPDTLSVFQSGNLNSYFGNSVTYNDGQYTLSNVTGRSINNHYTCGNSSGVCETVMYYFSSVSYIELRNGQTIEDAIRTNLSSEDVNQADSVIKSRIDSWFQSSLMNYSDKLEDTIFCNDRSINKTAGWNPNGGSLQSTSYLLFRSQISNSNADLSCPNLSDQFSMSNDIAKLKYPIALPTIPELRISNHASVRKNGDYYWTMSPNGLSTSGVGSVMMSYVTSSGSFTYNTVRDSREMNPVVSLKPNTKYVSGDGSKNNPYVVRDLYKSNIIINNDDSKGSIQNLSSTTNVEELSNVTFQIVPEDGYLVDVVQIKDNSNQEVSYQVSDNEYSFVMPGSNTTIEITYQKIKSSVGIEIVNETKDLTIQIEDLTQVEFQEDVVFKVVPIKGYQLSNLQIIDSDNNVIPFYETENLNEYHFSMPARDVTIIPSYEKVSSSITVEDNQNTKEFKIEVNDVTAVVYEETVRITIIPEDGYELESLTITDSDNQEVPYRKTNKPNEYEFSMPDKDVLIKPIYRKIENHDHLENPETGNKYLLFILVGGILFIGGLLIHKKNICN